MSGPDIQTLLDKVLGGDRLTAADCTALLESYDIARIGAAATALASPSRTALRS